MLCSGLRFPEIASGALSLYLLSPLCELSHRRILALGLTERTLDGIKARIYMMEKGKG